MIIAFKLLTAHILGDIRRFEGKGGDPQAGSLREELLNAGIFTLASVLLLMPGSQPRLWAGIVAAALVRGLVRALALLSGTGPVGRFLPGPTVETLRVCAVALVAIGMAGGATVSGPSWRRALDSPLLAFYALGYVAVVIGGGRVVQWVTRSFLARVSDASLRPGLPLAGRYIGWLERFLIVTFVALDYGEAVGFLLAAKALVRYPEIQEDRKGHFAEYFLVGTLTSVGLAILGGIILKHSASILQ
jgi:hypothetical protein